MRVLDSKPGSGMGKKHKLRKQSRENVVRVSDTSDDGVVGGETLSDNMLKHVTWLWVNTDQCSRKVLVNSLCSRK